MTLRSVVHRSGRADGEDRSHHLDGRRSRRVRVLLQAAGDERPRECDGHIDGLGRRQIPLDRRAEFHRPDAGGNQRVPRDPERAPRAIRRLATQPILQEGSARTVALACEVEVNGPTEEVGTFNGTVALHGGDGPRPCRDPGTTSLSRAEIHPHGFERPVAVDAHEAVPLAHERRARSVNRYDRNRRHEEGQNREQRADPHTQCLSTPRHDAPGIERRLFDSICLDAFRPRQGWSPKNRPPRRTPTRTILTVRSFAQVFVMHLPRPPSVMEKTSSSLVDCVLKWTSVPDMAGFRNGQINVRARSTTRVERAYD